MSHPTLEFLGLRLPRAHDQTIQARLTDDVRLLPTSNRIDDFSSTELVFIKHFDSLGWITEVKDAHAILEYEPRLPRLIGQSAQ